MRARFIVTQRTLWQLLYDKIEDWLDPNAVAKLFVESMKKPITIRQRDITDCGAASSCVIAAYYKLKLPVSRIRQLASTDKKGTNILGLIEAANKIGFDAKGVRGEFESLFKIPTPAIAHVVVKEVLHHYVVIYKVTSKYIRIMDPVTVLFMTTHTGIQENMDWYI